MATLLVNVVGSFVLAVITFTGAGEAIILAVGIGVCGSFTTFSSFSFETVRLWEGGERWLSVLNAAGNLLGSSVAIALAWLLVMA